MLKETVTNEEILEVENRGQLWNNCDYQTLKAPETTKILKIV